MILSSYDYPIRDGFWGYNLTRINSVQPETDLVIDEFIAAQDVPVQVRDAVKIRIDHPITETTIHAPGVMRFNAMAEEMLSASQLKLMHLVADMCDADGAMNFAYLYYEAHDDLVGLIRGLQPEGANPRSFKTQLVNFAGNPIVMEVALTEDYDLYTIGIRQKYLPRYDVNHHYLAHISFPPAVGNGEMLIETPLFDDYPVIFPKISAAVELPTLDFEGVLESCLAEIEQARELWSVVKLAEEGAKEIAVSAVTSVIEDPNLASAFAGLGLTAATVPKSILRCFFSSMTADVQVSSDGEEYTAIPSVDLKVDIFSSLGSIVQGAAALVAMVGGAVGAIIALAATLTFKVVDALRHEKDKQTQCEIDLSDPFSPATLAAVSPPIYVHNQTDLSPKQMEHGYNLFYPVSEPLSYGETNAYRSSFYGFRVFQFSDYDAQLIFTPSPSAHPVRWVTGVNDNQCNDPQLLVTLRGECWNPTVGGFLERAVYHQPHETLDDCLSKVATTVTDYAPYDSSSGVGRAAFLYNVMMAWMYSTIPNPTLSAQISAIFSLNTWPYIAPDGEHIIPLYSTRAGGENGQISTYAGASVQAVYDYYDALFSTYCNIPNGGLDGVEDKSPEGSVAALASMFTMFEICGAFKEPIAESIYAGHNNPGSPWSEFISFAGNSTWEKIVHLINNAFETRWFDLPKRCYENYSAGNDSAWSLPLSASEINDLTVKPQASYFNAILQSALISVVVGVTAVSARRALSGLNTKFALRRTEKREAKLRSAQEAWSSDKSASNAYKLRKATTKYNQSKGKLAALGFNSYQAGSVYNPVTKKVSSVTQIFSPTSDLEDYQLDTIRQVSGSIDDVGSAIGGIDGSVRGVATEIQSLQGDVTASANGVSQVKTEVSMLVGKLFTK